MERKEFDTASEYANTRRHTVVILRKRKRKRNMKKERQSEEERDMKREKTAEKRVE